MRQLYPVQVDQDLTNAGPVAAAKAFGGAIAAYAKTLEPRARAEFLMRLDTLLYWLHGESAIAANDGLHPKHRVMNYHDYFVNALSSNDTVIDLGCGVGALAASIASRTGAAVVGMDLSPTNLDKARLRAGKDGLDSRLSYILGDITTTRAPGIFSAIILSNVLEHLTDRVALLKLWREWYNPSTFLIRVPALDRDWRVPWKQELGVEWRLDETHETEYSRSQLLAELADAGLVAQDLIANWGEYWLRATPV